jgi:hypothetical protein
LLVKSNSLKNFKLSNELAVKYTENTKLSNLLYTRIKFNQDGFAKDVEYEPDYIEYR